MGELEPHPELTLIDLEHPLDLFVRQPLPAELLRLFTEQRRVSSAVPVYQNP